MISMQYDKLDAAEKLIYFEAAVNPILQKILQEEFNHIKEQILLIEKQIDESDKDFVLRFYKLKLQYTLLSEFTEINAKSITEIQNLNQN